MKRSTAVQFATFTAVGAAGFGVDVAVLYLAMKGLGLDPYSGRLASYLAAATATWALNRRFTFRPDAGGSHAGGMAAQWLRFLAVNAVGGAVNYVVYAVLMASGGTAAHHPAIAVAAGSLAGLLFNFTFSKKLVFGARTGA